FVGQGWNPAHAPAVSESVIQPELDQSGSNAINTGVLLRDPPEVVVVYVLVIEKEIRVVEQIVEIGVKLKALAFRDSRALGYSEIVAPVRRPGHNAPLQ